MNRRWRKVLTLAACVVLAAGSASAGEKKGADKSRSMSAQPHSREAVRVGGIVIPDIRRDDRRDRRYPDIRRDDRRDHRYKVRRNGNRPPGWRHGRKTGWGNCNLPPGQAKKHGCRQYTRRRSNVPVIVLPGGANRR